MLVVKVGGAAGIRDEAVCDDVASLWREGTRLVLLHGGSAETDALSRRLGHPPRYVTSVSGFVSRVTDPKTLEIFLMVYCGKRNKRLVEALQRRGVNAVGLSGLDGGLLRGRRKETLRILEGGKRRVLRNDYTGMVTDVNRELLLWLLSREYLPVLTPPALSERGEAINVDGDRVAARVAVALHAGTVVFLSNVPGLLRDPEDPGSVIPRLRRADLPAVLEGSARGRMRKKILGIEEALAGGVRRCVIADARVAQPVRAALAGRGTVVEP